MNSNGNGTKEPKKTRRILAWICLGLMAVLIAALIIAAFAHVKTGTILALLFVLMAVPFVFFACITYLKQKEEYLKDKLEEKPEEK